MSEQESAASPEEKPVENKDVSMEAVAAAAEKTDDKKEQPAAPSRRTALTAILEGELDTVSMDDDAFRDLFDNKFSKVKEDEMVHGKVVSVTRDEILVDIGFKSLGIVPRAEFVGAETLTPGDDVDVFVEKIEDKDGRLILSRRRADFMKTWEDILKLHEEQTVTPVRILRRIKGGMVVDLLGIEAFLPGSQIDVRPVRDFDAWVGKALDVRVVKVNHPSENVVVSHKVLLEEQLAEQRGKILSTSRRASSSKASSRLSPTSASSSTSVALTALCTSPTSHGVASPTRARSSSWTSRSRSWSSTTIRTASVFRWA